MAVGRYNDKTSTSGSSDDATVMTKPTIDGKPSGGGDSWSAAVVALHSDNLDGLDGDGTPTTIRSSDNSPMKKEVASPLPTPHAVPGERENLPPRKESNGPSSRISMTNGNTKEATCNTDKKTTRQAWNVTMKNVQPRPLSPVADMLLSEPSLSSSAHSIFSRSKHAVGKGTKKTSVNSNAAVNKKPLFENPAYVYIEHEVLPTDTLQGLCLAYKISATKLRMENKFSGNSLTMAPKILKIPVDIENIKKMPVLGVVDEAKEMIVPGDENRGTTEMKEKKETSLSKNDNGVLLFVDTMASEENEEEERIPWLVRSTSSAAEEEKEEVQYTMPDLNECKRRLQDSIDSLSHRLNDFGQPVLTASEINFLQALLESNSPGAAEACMAAHERLMDGSLFWTTATGDLGTGSGDSSGAAVSEPGKANSMMTPGGADSGVYSFVSDLLSVGTSIISVEEDPEQLQFNSRYDEGDLKAYSDISGDENEGASGENYLISPDEPLDSPAEPTTTNSVRSGEGLGVDVDERKENSKVQTPEDCAPPASAAKKAPAISSKCTTVSINYLDSSTKERLDRLEQRRQQSNHLLLAHEAGLVITAGGSARRSLMKMGLPMEKGLYNNAPPTQRMVLSPIQDEVHSKSVSECSTEDAEKQAVDDILRTLSDAVKLEEGDDPIIEHEKFEKVLAKMDERTLRRIEKEEQKKKEPKRKVWSTETENAVARISTPQHHMGCNSPFSMSMLRRHFASKQFSIQRESSNSSSYTRFDSFLLHATETTDSDGLLLRHGDGYDDDDDDDCLLFGHDEKPSSDERLTNLLVNAGFKDVKSYDTTDTLVLDAKPEDDEDILAMSARSTNSVAVLMKGGPSYRNVDMFRGDDEDAEDKKETHDLNKRSSSAQAVAIDNDNKGNLSDEDASDDGASIPSLHSDLGELPSLLPPLPPVDRLSQSARTPRSSSKFQRRATIGIMKTSSSNNNSTNKKYKRSVSWNRRVFAKEEAKEAAALDLTRQDSALGGLSVISFPNLAQALPIVRSDSIASDAMASILSRTPSLHHARSVHSPPRSSSSVASIGGPPLLSHAHSIRSDFGALVTDDLDESSLNSGEYAVANQTRPIGTAWKSPLVSLQETKKSRVISGGNGEKEEGEEHPVFIHPTSSTRVYEGVGIEIEDFPQMAVLVPVTQTMESNAHEKYQNMISVFDNSVRSARSNRFDESLRSSRSLAQRIDESARSARTNNNSWNNRFLRDDSYRSSLGRGLSLSGRSRRSSINLRNDAPPLTSLDDGFIIKNIHFERYSSEILRSLSNEDLMSPPPDRTMNGGVVSNAGDVLTGTESWELENNLSNPVTTPNWPALEDECAGGYGAHGALPFLILGTSAADKDCHPHVLSPPLMESLQNFLPPAVSFANFWLKYSLVRDRLSLPSLLQHIRGSKHTFIAIETVGGEVFGSFTSSPWQNNCSCHDRVDGGEDVEAFLWRMRRTRATKDAQRSVIDRAKLESEIDVYYREGTSKDQVQHCTLDMLAVGGRRSPQSQKEEGDSIFSEGAKDVLELPSQNSAFPNSAVKDAGSFGLAINSELLKGTSSSCSMFRSPPLSASHADGSPFEILNVEVWAMTPCVNVADAENLEMRNLFLDY